nr:MAG: putative coat protein [Tombusviridae sp.]
MTTRRSKRNTSESQQARSKRTSSSKGTGGVRATRVTPPQAAGMIVGTIPPYIGYRGANPLLHGTEIVATIGTSTTNTLAVEFACIPSSLPWGSGIAVNFAKWRWRSLRFIFIPQCSTTTSGGLTLGIEYDTSETSPTTQIQLAQSYRAITTPYWGGSEGVPMLQSPGTHVQGAVCTVFDTARVSKPWYAYKTSSAYGALTVDDRNIYSPGKALVITNGGPTGQVTAGYLYAQYMVELTEPVSSTLNA